MNREEDSCRLNPALFSMRDVVHPVFKCIQIDTSYSDTVRRNIHQSPEESLSRRLEIDNDDRVQLHRRWYETQRHKDTEAQRGAQERFLMRSPLCLCVFV